jgi:hypothetical protein
VLSFTMLLAAPKHSLTAIPFLERPSPWSSVAAEVPCSRRHLWSCKAACQQKGKTSSLSTFRQVMETVRQRTTRECHFHTTRNGRGTSARCIPVIPFIPAHRCPTNCRLALGRTQRSLFQALLANRQPSSTMGWGKARVSSTCQCPSSQPLLALWQSRRT